MVPDRQPRDSQSSVWARMAIVTGRSRSTMIYRLIETRVACSSRVGMSHRECFQRSIRSRARRRRSLRLSPPSTSTSLNQSCPVWNWRSPLRSHSSWMKMAIICSTELHMTIRFASANSSSPITSSAWPSYLKTERCKGMDWLFLISSLLRFSKISNQRYAEALQTG